MTTSIAARRACLAILGVIVLVAAAIAFMSVAPSRVGVWLRADVR